MVTIALRFIPTLLQEVDTIMKAQRARGASFNRGGPLRRARALVPVLVPLFILSFRRADELALAMEARCYQPGSAAHPAASAAGSPPRRAAARAGRGRRRAGGRSCRSRGAASRPAWRLELAYDGTPFDGWARQPGRRTVQGELEDGPGDGAARAGAPGRGRPHRCRRARRGPGRLVCDRARARPRPPDAGPERAAARRDRRQCPLAGAGRLRRACRHGAYLSLSRLAARRPGPSSSATMSGMCVARLDTDLLAAAAQLLVGRRDFSALTPSARFYRTCEREVTRAAWRRGGRRPRGCASRSPPAASCTIWCVSPWARWSTWPRDA